ncbi:MAG: Hsp20/alpha crystallin family protein [Nitrospirota bacterium]
MITMRITALEPINSLRTVKDDLDRVFRGAFLRPFWDIEENNTPPVSRLHPPVDIYEDKNQIAIRSEVPGINPEEIEVKVEDGVLTIKGERKFEEEKKDRYFHTIERSYGNFYRRFDLPSTVDKDKISAEYKHGLLNITLPKKEESQPKKIDIKLN